MRVFVTGATGFVGSVVVEELLAHGHTVLGLARNDAAVEKLTAAGVEVHRGTLEDASSLVAGAAACDAVAHLAFDHDFSNFAENMQKDRRVVEALANGLANTGKPLVVTFGVATIRPGGVVTENDRGGPEAMPRLQTENFLLDAAKRGVHAIALRLPPSTHGRGDKGFVPMLIDVARKTGVSAYVGDGQNRWSAGHRHDAAKLYRLALEKAPPGTVVHATVEEGVPFRDIAQTIGDGLELPTKSVTPDEAKAHFGWFAGFAGLNMSASNAMTRQTLGWTPTGIGLLQDMRENGYFD